MQAHMQETTHRETLEQCTQQANGSLLVQQMFKVIKQAKLMINDYNY